MATDVNCSVRCSKHVVRSRTRSVISHSMESFDGGEMAVGDGFCISMTPFHAEQVYGGARPLFSGEPVFDSRDLKFVREQEVLDFESFRVRKSLASIIPISSSFD